MDQRRAHLFLLAVVFLALCASVAAQGAAAWEPRRIERESDESTADKRTGVAAGGSRTATNSTEKPKEKETIAQILDEALKEEFKQEEEKKSEQGKQFNETAITSEATKETVIVISKNKAAANRTAEAAAAAKEAANATAAGAGAGRGAAAGKAGLSGGGSKSNATAVDLDVEPDVDRIIDSKDNEYVLSKPNEEGAMGLNLDPAFVKDLTVLVGASALAGLGMEAIGQPTINGYFMAGSVIGPGGLNWVKELVQVQSVAQLGVQLLLFGLGLEFSLAKLRSVRHVALLGGLLEVVLCAVLGGLGAKFIGTSAQQGVFVGVVVSMSSTSVVIKTLGDSHSAGTQAGQITIGTLILQDCMVGLLFALMPVLSSGSLQGGFQLAATLAVLWRLALKLAGVAVAAVVVARTVLVPLTRLLAKRFSAEVFQLSALSFCFMAALITQKQGISAELGAFLAGVMLSATDQQEAIVAGLAPVSRLFLALFVASTGLVLSPRFLAHHLPVLAAGVLVVIIAKAGLIAGVVGAFGYPAETALAVGINLAQIGEFAFVLLSVASQLALIPSSVYLLLMGVTALSLLPSLLPRPWARPEKKKRSLKKRKAAELAAAAGAAEASGSAAAVAVAPAPAAAAAGAEEQPHKKKREKKQKEKKSKAGRAEGTAAERQGEPAAAAEATTAEEVDEVAAAAALVAALRGAAEAAGLGLGGAAAAGGSEKKKKRKRKDKGAAA